MIVSGECRCVTGKVARSMSIRAQAAQLMQKSDEQVKICFCAYSYEMNIRDG